MKKINKRILFPKQKDLDELILSPEPKLEIEDIGTLNAYSISMRHEDKKKVYKNSIISKIEYDLFETELFKKENGVLKFSVPRVQNPKKKIVRNRANKFQPKNPEKLFIDLAEELFDFFLDNRTTTEAVFNKYREYYQIIKALRESRNLLLKAGITESSFEKTLKTVGKWGGMVSNYIKSKARVASEKDLMTRLYKIFRKHRKDGKGGELAFNAIYICIAYLFKAFLPNHEAVYSTFQTIKKYLSKNPAK